MISSPSPGFLASRPFLLAPPPEIAEAAHLLQQAVIAHNAGDSARAATFILKADLPPIAAWTEALWGERTADIHRWRPLANLPPFVEQTGRAMARMPTQAIKNALIARDGYHCRYCGIPVIRSEVRERIRRAYPQALRWGNRNSLQHAAFQGMRLAYEHLLPHARGGQNTLENMVISCDPCNCGKDRFMLEELGLHDPRHTPPFTSAWNGLENFHQLPLAETSPRL